MCVCVCVCVCGGNGDATFCFNLCYTIKHFCQPQFTSPSFRVIKPPISKTSVAIFRRYEARAHGREWRQDMFDLQQTTMQGHSRHDSMTWSSFWGEDLRAPIYDVDPTSSQSHDPNQSGAHYCSYSHQNGKCKYRSTIGTDSWLSWQSMPFCKNGMKRGGLTLSFFIMYTFIPDRASDALRTGIRRSWESPVKASGI